MALEDYFEPFIMMNWKSVSDGQGGVEWEWEEGAKFEAGISVIRSAEAAIAYQAGTRTIFNIVTKKNVGLEQDDRVKRVSDGRLYRITSNSKDMGTPNMAENQFWQVTAEVVEA